MALILHINYSAWQGFGLYIQSPHLVLQSLLPHGQQRWQVGCFLPGPLLQSRLVADVLGPDFVLT